jgi:hypothetical protein
MRSIKQFIDGVSGKTKQRLILQGEQTIVSRGMYDTVTESKYPVVQVKFQVKQAQDGKTGEHIDEVEIELDLFAANKFASDLLATIDACMPRRATGARRVPFEG